METITSLDRKHLWQLIQALSLNTDNKIWLAQKLINEARVEQEEEQQQQVAEPPCQYGMAEKRQRLYEAETRILEEDPGIDPQDIEKELFKEMPWLK